MTPDQTVRAQGGSRDYSRPEQEQPAQRSVEDLTVIPGQAAWHAPAARRMPLPLGGFQERPAAMGVIVDRVGGVPARAGPAPTMVAGARIRAGVKGRCQQ